MNHDDNNSDIGGQRHPAPAQASRVVVNHSFASSGIQATPYFYCNNGEAFYGHYNYPSTPEEAKFIGIIPWIIRILKICALGLGFLSSSVVLYGCFYWVFMPGSYASRPLFFDYTGTVIFPHSSVIDRDHLVSQEHPDSQFRVATASRSSQNVDSCTHTPWAAVDFFSKEQAIIWGETVHEELIPPQEALDRILQPRQGYYVEIHLVLPESDTNREAGMFGVTVDLLSDFLVGQNGTTLKLASSVRSARLPHESGWLQVARKCVWILPLILGGMQESRVLVVQSFRHIVESKDYPLRFAVVRLVAQTSYHTRHDLQRYSEQQLRSPVEVIAAQIRIGEELSAWQQLLKDWFFTCYFFGTLLLFGAHLFAWLLLQYYWAKGKNFDDPYFDSSIDFGEDEWENGHGRDHDDNGDSQVDDSYESIRSNEESNSGPNTFGEDGNVCYQQEDCDQTEDNNWPSEESFNGSDWEQCSHNTSSSKESDQEVQDEFEPQNVFFPSRELSSDQRYSTKIDGFRFINGQSNNLQGSKHSQNASRLSPPRRRKKTKRLRDETVSARTKKPSSSQAYKDVMNDGSSFFDCLENDDAMSPLRGSSCRDTISTQENQNVSAIETDTDRNSFSSGDFTDLRSSGAKCVSNYWGSLEIFEPKGICHNTEKQVQMQYASSISCLDTSEKTRTDAQNENRHLQFPKDHLSALENRAPFHGLEMHPMGESQEDCMKTRASPACDREPNAREELVEFARNETNQEGRFQVGTAFSDDPNQIVVVSSIESPKTPEVVFNVPEAQVLDSFLHDLISPFVK